MMFAVSPTREVVPVGRLYPQIAQIVSSEDAIWDAISTPDPEGWLPDGHIKLHRGKAEIHFNSGAVLVMRAPAEFEAVSDTEVNLLRGTLAARVDGATTSFRVNTPTSEVDDLGTEFGVTVPLSGETDVAVFDGIVDVRASIQSDNDRAMRLQRRLTSGEALRIDWEGQFQRIATIADDSFPPLPRAAQSLRAPLITSVSDNIRDEEDSIKFYRIVPRGFGEDVRAYVDRNHEWNGLDESGMPEFLVGADYIMTFNDDKEREVELTVTVGEPAVVFVLFDERVPPPQWLRQSFINTGLKIGMDEDEGRARYYSGPPLELGKGPGVNVDTVFAVWKQKLAEPGAVVLGPRGGGMGFSMYGIAVIPLDAWRHRAPLAKEEGDDIALASQ